MPQLRNARHEAVLQAFLRDKRRVGWRAYKSVYRRSSQRAAEVAWSRLLTVAEFKARHDELLGQVTKAAVDAAVMDLNAVLVELSKLGRSNMQHYFNPDGTFVGIGNLTADQAAAVSGLKIKPHLLRTGKGKKAKTIVAHEVEFKLHDKRGSLGELRRHLEPTKPQEHHHTVTLEMLVAASMEKNAKPAPAKKAKAAA